MQNHFLKLEVSISLSIMKDVMLSVVTLSVHVECCYTVCITLTYVIL
jgi:hypothetical protein